MKLAKHGFGIVVFVIVKYNLRQNENAVEDWGIVVVTDIRDATKAIGLVWLIATEHASDFVSRVRKILNQKFHQSDIFCVSPPGKIDG